MSYRRSLSAVTVSFALKHIMHAKSTFERGSYEKAMQKTSQLNNLPYQLPAKKLKGLSYEKKTVNGFDYFVINPQASAHGILLYIHGGAYIHRPTTHHIEMIAEFCRKANVATVLPIYGLAPHHNIVEARKFILTIYKKLLSQTPSSKIIIMGDSAGGGLTLSVLSLLREKKLPMPKHAILLSPWVDVTMTNPEIAPLEKHDPMLSAYGLKKSGQLFAGKFETNDPIISPLYGNFKNFPDTDIYVGTYELFLPDVTKLAKKMKQEGVNVNLHVWPKMNHVFPAYPIKEGEEARKQIISIIKKVLDQ